MVSLLSSSCILGSVSFSVTESCEVNSVLCLRASAVQIDFSCHCCSLSVCVCVWLCRFVCAVTVYVEELANILGSINKTQSHPDSEWLPRLPDSLTVPPRPSVFFSFCTSLFSSLTRDSWPFARRAKCQRILIMSAHQERTGCSYRDYITLTGLVRIFQLSEKHWPS